MPSFDLDRTARVGCVPDDHHTTFLANLPQLNARELKKSRSDSGSRKCAALYNCVALTNTASYLSFRLKIQCLYHIQSKRSY